MSFLRSTDSFRLHRLQTSEVPRLQVQQSKSLVSAVTLKQARKRSVVKSLNMASSTKASGSFLKRGTSSSGLFWMNLAAMWKCKVSESYIIDWKGPNSSYPCYISRLCTNATCLSIFIVANAPLGVNVCENIPNIT